MHSLIYVRHKHPQSQSPVREKGEKNPLDAALKFHSFPHPPSISLSLSLSLSLSFSVSLLLLFRGNFPLRSTGRKRPVFLCSLFLSLFLLFSKQLFFPPRFFHFSPSPHLLESRKKGRMDGSSPERAYLSSSSSSSWNPFFLSLSLV